MRTTGNQGVKVEGSFDGVGHHIHGMFSPPPVKPEISVPGYNVPGYMRLIASVPEYERKMLLNELDSGVVSNHAKILLEKYESGHLSIGNLDESRNNFLAALKCLQQGKLTVEQVASLHIWDSAMRLYYTDAAGVRLVYEYVKEGGVHRSTLMSPAASEGRPTECQVFRYKTSNHDIHDTLNPHIDGVNIPLVQQFFNFTQDEYQNFCHAMKKAPETEKQFMLLIRPQEGCVSSLLPKLSQVVSCMQDMKIWVPKNDGFVEHVKVALIPSFTMLQAVLDVKAKTLGNAPVQLIPTYYMLDQNDYARLKLTRQLAVGLYLPKAYQAHSSDDRRYLQTVDGYAQELPYASIMHDFYHALRELTMERSVADARWRLAAILRDGPVETKIIDGELINSYSRSMDTIRVHKSRSIEAELFGDLLASLKLTSEQKLACIRDMVVHRDEWRENFKLSHRDLSVEDRKIYNALAAQYYDEYNLTDESLLHHINDLNVVKHHVEKLKVDVNEVHYWYRTRAIDFAIQSGNMEAILYLMSQGARLFDEDCNNAANALYWLADYMTKSSYRENVLDKLIELFLENVSRYPTCGLTTSHVNALRGVLPNESDVHQPDSYGLLPIHYAIMCGKITTEWFVKAKYDLLAPIGNGIYQGMSILSLLLYCRRDQVMLELISKLMTTQPESFDAFNLLKTNVFIEGISRHCMTQVEARSYQPVNFNDQTILDILVQRKFFELLKKLCCHCTLRERMELKLHERIDDDDMLSEIMTYVTPIKQEFTYMPRGI